MKTFLYLLGFLLLCFMLGFSFGRLSEAIALKFKDQYPAAKMRMPDGEVLEVKVRKWSGYNDQIKVISEDGKTYLVNSANIILIRDKEE